ncbi:L-ribulose-5-phosphate 4-epimerase [Subtercola sp. YIM 133946]|uniref:L-ribulose-5-phosphate 4-epimerase n=1 Tax=Subtercola sp. YIM 133946 TaxID=3118909 RepID=UPI002F936EE9
MNYGAEVEVAIARTRADVARLHDELTRYGLSVWTGGNISARVPKADLFVIKPRGVSYSDLSPENMVLCDLEGAQIEHTPGSDRTPSIDTAAHAYVYRHMSHVGGVVHTHSTYATAWSARGESIPCVTASMAGEFGGDIPVTPVAGAGAIGEGVVGALTGHRSPAVLLQNHGVMTIGATARDAVRSAVLAEDSARTVHISRQLGDPRAIPQGEIDALFAR